jgi:hypothetical protein
MTNYVAQKYQCVETDGDGLPMFGVDGELVGVSVRRSWDAEEEEGEGAAEGAAEEGAVDEEGGSEACMRHEGEWRFGYEDVGGTFVWGSEQKLCIDVGSDEWFLSSWVAEGGENDSIRRVYTEALHTMFRLMLAGESDASNTRE